MRKSFRIAYGGILAGLSLISMLLTSVFPFAEYTLPAIAGILLIAMVIEFDFRTAFVTFAAVAVLSAVLTSNKEAAALFVFFFGYYPIIKGKIENIGKKIFQWLCKLGIFNLAVVTAYLVLIHLFSMQEFLEDFRIAQYGAGLFLIAGNAVFVLYDIAVTRIISFYIYRIRPKFVR